jgi:hypothetical protein
MKVCQCYLSDSVHLKKKAVVFETSWCVCVCVCVCFQTMEGVLLVTSDVLQVVPLSMAETRHELKSFYVGKVILDLCDSRKCRKCLRIFL